MASAIITPRNDGPYHIKGEFTIVTQGGKPVDVDKDEVWLCRCGHSSNKPFCDGTHRKAGFANNLDDPPQAGPTA
jgi:CDGSH-type Zn-finger protein